MNHNADWLDQVNDWREGVSASAQAPGEGIPAPRRPRFAAGFSRHGGARLPVPGQVVDLDKLHDEPSRTDTAPTPQKDQDQAPPAPDSTPKAEAGTEKAKQSSTEKPGNEEQPETFRDAVRRRLHEWAAAIEKRAGVEPPESEADAAVDSKDTDKDSAPDADESTGDTPPATAVSPHSDDPDGKGTKNEGVRFVSNRSRRFFKAAQRAKEKISKDEELSQEEKGKQIAEAIEADPLARDGLGEQLVDDVVDFIPEGMTKKAAIQYGDYVIENADQWKIGRATRKASAFWEAVSDLVKWTAYNGSAALAGHSVPWWTGGQYPSLTDLTRRLLFSLGENSEQWWVVPLVGVSATFAVWLAIDIKPREWCKTKSEIAQNSGNRLRKLLDLWFIPGWIFRIPLASVAAATAITAVPAVIQISTGAPT